MAKIHRLKTWSEHFRRVDVGSKSFEIRYDDRGYEEGDYLVLDEWDQDRCAYTTAKPIVRIVTCVVRGFGLHEGYVAMGVDRLAHKHVADTVLDVAPTRGEGGAK